MLLRKGTEIVPWRVQLGLIASGYAAVLIFGGAIIYLRDLQERAHPDDVAASSGMYAFGDAVLYMFVAFLFLIPTAFLMRLFARFEAPYTVYSRILFALSLSAPIALAVYCSGDNYSSSDLGILVFIRVWWSPLILFVILVSRLVARFDRAKRAASYALLIEGATFAVGVALLIFVGFGKPR